MKLNYFFAAAALAYGSSLVIAIPIEQIFEARDLDNDDLITREVVGLEARELPIVDIEAREFDDEDLELRDLEDLEERELEDIAKRGRKGKGRWGGGRGRRARVSSGAEDAPPPSE